MRTTSKYMLIEGNAVVMAYRSVWETFELQGF